MGFWDLLCTSLGLREENEHKTTNQIPQSVSYKGQKISICVPTNFQEVVQFVKNLYHQIPIIVNFASLKPNEAVRSLDFVCGAVCAMRGELQKIGKGIYFYAPKDMQVLNYTKTHKRG